VQSLEVQSVVHANFLVGSFLLSKPKVACWEQKKIVFDHT
jgi:hypothetical protein